MTNLRRAVILSITLLFLNSTAKADPWSDGWCEGYRLAVKNIRDERDHWRSMLQLPIGSKDNVVDQVVSIMADSVDHYLIPPPLVGIIHIQKNILLNDKTPTPLDFVAIDCGKDPTQ